MSSEQRESEANSDSENHTEKPTAEATTPPSLEPNSAPKKNKKRPPKAKSIHSDAANLQPLPDATTCETAPTDGTSFSVYPARYTLGNFKIPAQHCCLFFFETADLVYECQSPLDHVMQLLHMSCAADREDYWQRARMPMDLFPGRDVCIHSVQWDPDKTSKKMTISNDEKTFGRRNQKSGDAWYYSLGRNGFSSGQHFFAISIQGEASWTPTENLKLMNVTLGGLALPEL